MIVVKKGYTVTVTSWENDGDNYRTESETYQSKELVEAIVKMCKTLFASCNNGDGGIGNTNEYETDNARKTIISYMKANPILYDNKKLSDAKLIDACMNYNYSLMGSSEYYYSRVFESLVVTYSDKDIEVEEVKF